jgi:hypothetical protein
VRDTKDRDVGAVRFTADVWKKFIAGIELPQHGEARSGKPGGPFLCLPAWASKPRHAIRKEKATGPLTGNRDQQV